MKKLRNVIDDARKQGHKVVVRREKDGSGATRVRVVSIDGKKYNKSQGNNELRKMMGEELSDRMKAQRKQANLGDGTPSGQSAQREKHVSNKKGENLPKLTKAEMRQLRRMNARVKRTGHGFRMTAKQRRKMKKEKSAEENRRQMERRETASRGDVYPEKIADFVSHLIYLVSNDYPSAPYVKKILRFLNKHGRIGKDGKYRFFKGHSLSDYSFYRAEQVAYKLEYKDLTAMEYESIANKVIDLLKMSIKVDGRRKGDSKDLYDIDRFAEHLWDKFGDVKMPK